MAKPALVRSGSRGLTRKLFMRRASAAIGGAAAYTILGPPATAPAPTTITYTNCPNPIYGHAPKSDQCRNAYGPPVCTGPSPATAYNPGPIPEDGTYQMTCTSYCPVQCTGCAPDYYQGKAGACNSGDCYCACAC